MEKIYWIIPLVIFAVNGAGALLLNQYGPDNWQVYRNARYDFTVEYPPGWELNVAPDNNDGREFLSADGNTTCRAYGYINSLTNIQGDPQTLDEFIDWLVDGNMTTSEVIERNNTTLSGEPAIELILRDSEGTTHAVYTMDERTGRALTCFFNDVSSQKKFSDSFYRMAKSFTVGDVYLGDEFAGQFTMCVNMIGGVTRPLKDRETFLDENYTEVTITSRDAWDVRRLPKQVTTLEKKGYECFPMPFEFDDVGQSAGINIEPAVTSVQWNCELEYDDYSFVKSSADAAKQKLERQGYACEKRECIDDSQKKSFAWLCSK